MSALRPRALSSDWYPREAAACAEALDAHAPASVAPGAFGAIVPHAGWRYALPLFGPVLKALAKERPDADVVVLFAGHTEAADAPRIFVEGGFDTPLGPIAVPERLAQDLAMALMEPDLETPDEHYEDYGVEVLLPAIRHLWPKAPLLVVGPPPTVRAIELGREVARMLGVHNLKRPIILGSSDLTHYGPDHGYRPKGTGVAAQAWVKAENEGPLLKAIERLDGPEILWTAERARSACSAGAIAAAIAAAHKLGARQAALLDHRTSHEISGDPAPPSSFVSYASVALGGSR